MAGIASHGSPNRGRAAHYRRPRIEALESRLLLSADPGLLLASIAEGEEPAMPDFSLADVNATSTTHNQQVSPRDYLQQVSGWYFGHAL